MMGFEPESGMHGGNPAYQAAISTAISAKRMADTLERIELAMVKAPKALDPEAMARLSVDVQAQLVDFVNWHADTTRPWWAFWRKPVHTSPTNPSSKAR